MNKPVRNAKTTHTTHAHKIAQKLFGQTVLVLQGGGALGAYQVGVYQAMHEAGIEPDWIIGTSIGAINGAIIAGNKPEHRLAKLHEFWDHVENQLPSYGPLAWLGLGNALANANTVLQGIPSFFTPNPSALLGVNTRVGVDQAAYYTTEPLRETLSSLVDFDFLRKGPSRLTVGAVHVQSGDMRYFDSRDEQLAVEHVMASGALPPAFPAVRVNGEPYWDGGIYSNTPLEAVLDDNPRLNSTIFAVNVWQQIGPEPQSIWEVMGRQKEIQYASKSESHIERQKQIHRLRHIIRELHQYLPEDAKTDIRAQELASWGCGTTMHVLRLDAPRVAGEDQTKDIDFSSTGIHTRWEAGYADTMEMIKRAPWALQNDGIEGVIEHLRGK
jgi:NTE family protein